MPIATDAPDSASPNTAPEAAMEAQVEPESNAPNSAPKAPTPSPEPPRANAEASSPAAVSSRFVDAGFPSEAVAAAQPLPPEAFGGATEATSAPGGGMAATDPSALRAAPQAASQASTWADAEAEARVNSAIAQSSAPVSAPAPAQIKPDHGENFVPGSESAPDNLAPQPLDHFKRGYRERAELRDREMGHLNKDFDHQGEGGERGGGGENRGDNKGSGGDSIRGDDRDNDRRREREGGARPSRMDDCGSYGEVTTGGFEVADLVDRLTDIRNRGRDSSSIVEDELDRARSVSPLSFESGKAVTAVLSQLARRREMGAALAVWRWMDRRGIKRNVFHYNSLISVCEKMKNWERAMNLLDQMEREGVKKNEVTFSSAISACEKSGNWKTALELLKRMRDEGVQQTAIAYNAAISACEKGLNPAKALEIFEIMKAEGVRPTVVTVSLFDSYAFYLAYGLFRRIAEYLLLFVA